MTTPETIFKILTLNNIRVKGLERFPRDRYEISSETARPDAVLLRSYNLHDWSIPTTLQAVGRAGAGVNNIPVQALSAKGIPVFNTPGANANAVKELVLLAMLLAARKVIDAAAFTQSLSGTDNEIDKLVEAEKKNFAGIELMGRTLGVVGLGAIGVRVANAAINLGMNVIGYDPNITVKNAWQLRSEVQGASSVTELLSQSDFVSVHVPLLQETKHLIDARRLAKAKPNLIILNFSRAQIVDDAAVIEALDHGRIQRYVSDFPKSGMIGHPGVICLPHLGASTEEAEENCAVMVADEVRAYLETGSITNSVNFPEMHLPGQVQNRLVVANANVPHMIERISSAISAENINILDMLNRSRQDIACTLVECEKLIPDTVIQKIKSIEGVLNVRVITAHGRSNKSKEIELAQAQSQD